MALTSNPLPQNQAGATVPHIEGPAAGTTEPVPQLSPSFDHYLAGGMSPAGLPQVSLVSTLQGALPLEAWTVQEVSRMLLYLCSHWLSPIAV